MTTASDAFERWRTAETEVEEATLLVLDAVRHGDAFDVTAQQKVVQILQCEAAERLREYLRLVKLETSRLLADQTPKVTGPKAGVR
jgi:hypothetical protein